MSNQNKTGETRPSVPDRQAYRLQPTRPKQILNRKDSLNDHGRLLLSNIGHSIIDDDIYKKFGEIGKVDHVVMHWNRDNGLKTGTAEVWFKCGNSADKLKKTFNGFDVFNDGHLIRIEKPSIFVENKDFWKKVFVLQKQAAKTITED